MQSAFPRPSRYSLPWAVLALALLGGCLGATIDRSGHREIIGDGGAGVCTGNVTSSACSGRAPSSTPPYVCPFGCSTIGGGPCVGTADCGATSSQAVCNNALGCTWNGTNCYGEPAIPCSASFQTMSLCGQTPGCYWTAGTSCGGTPAPCSSMDYSNCSAAPGCTWSRR